MKTNLISFLIMLAGGIGASTVHADQSLYCPKKSVSCSVTLEVEKCKAKNKTTGWEYLVGASVSVRNGRGFEGNTAKVTIDKWEGKYDTVRDRKCTTEKDSFTVTPGCTLKYGAYSKGVWHNEKCPSTGGHKPRPWSP